MRCRPQLARQATDDSHAPTHAHMHVHTRTPAVLTHDLFLFLPDSCFTVHRLACLVTHPSSCRSCLALLQAVMKELLAEAGVSVGTSSSWDELEPQLSAPGQEQLAKVPASHR